MSFTDALLKLEKRPVDYLFKNLIQLAQLEQLKRIADSLENMEKKMKEEIAIVHERRNR